MDGDLKKVTAAEFVKLTHQLCEEHGRVRVSREEHEAGAILTIKARSTEPVRCLLPIARRSKA